MPRMPTRKRATGGPLQALLKEAHTIIKGKTDEEILELALEDYLMSESCRQLAQLGGSAVGTPETEVPRRREEHAGGRRAKAASPKRRKAS